MTLPSDAGGVLARHPGVILYPYGQPGKPEHAELCSRFVVEAGGDVRRVIDGPFPSLERFIEFARRLPALRERVIANQRPIVVLTHTNPVALAVVNARRKIETVLPGLQRAVWAVFADPAEDPFFFDTIAAFGRLEGARADVPIWQDPNNRPFIILSPEIERSSRVRTAVRVLFDEE